MPDDRKFSEPFVGSKRNKKLFGWPLIIGLYVCQWQLIVCNTLRNDKDLLVEVFFLINRMAVAVVHSIVTVVKFLEWLMLLTFFLWILLIKLNSSSVKWAIFQLSFVRNDTLSDSGSNKCIKQVYKSWILFHIWQGTDLCVILVQRIFIIL